MECPIPYIESVMTSPECGLHLNLKEITQLWCLLLKESNSVFEDVKKEALRSLASLSGNSMCKQILYDDLLLHTVQTMICNIQSHDTIIQEYVCKVVVGLSSHIQTHQDMVTMLLPRLHEVLHMPDNWLNRATIRYVYQALDVLHEI